MLVGVGGGGEGEGGLPLLPVHLEPPGVHLYFPSLVLYYLLQQLFTHWEFVEQNAQSPSKVDPPPVLVGVGGGGELLRHCLPPGVHYGVRKKDNKLARDPISRICQTTNTYQSSTHLVLSIACAVFLTAALIKTLGAGGAKRPVTKQTGGWRRQRDSTTPRTML